MGRPKLPDEKKKVGMRITVDKEVERAAKASGNRSEWVNTICKDYLEGQKKKKKEIRYSLTHDKDQQK